MICFLCEKPIFVEDKDYPSNAFKATEFIGGGFYGSTVTDNIEGAKYGFYICDECFKNYINDKEKVQKFRTIYTTKREYVNG